MSRLFLPDVQPALTQFGLWLDQTLGQDRAYYSGVRDQLCGQQPDRTCTMRSLWAEHANRESSPIQERRALNLALTTHEPACSGLLLATLTRNHKLVERFQTGPAKGRIRAETIDQRQLTVGRESGRLAVWAGDEATYLPSDLTPEGDEEMHGKVVKSRRYPQEVSAVQLILDAMQQEVQDMLDFRAQLAQSV